MQPSQGPAGLVLSDDLVFASRITATARALALEVRQARSADALVQLARLHAPRGVFIDLGFPGLNLAELIGRLEQTCSARPRLIAFGSHVDAASLRAARAAGCDPVLPRTKFVEDLPRELPSWLANS
jgi:CheY-like chemotaxis protein